MDFSPNCISITNRTSGVLQNLGNTAQFLPNAGLNVSNLSSTKCEFLFLQRKETNKLTCPSPKLAEANAPEQFVILR